jgi:hypothetical protein
MRLTAFRVSPWLQAAHLRLTQILAYPKLAGWVIYCRLFWGSAQALSPVLVLSLLLL